MFDIFPSIEQRKMAHNFVLHYNFGNRGKGDGNQRMQETGILGQICLGDLLGMPRPSGEYGFDGGYDFVINGINTDIKTMGRTVDVKDHYVHNFIGYQLKYDCEYYIFASYNLRLNKLQICGIVSKKEFLQKAHYYHKGDKRYRDDGTYFYSRAPLYEIKQSDLHTINSKEDIIAKVK